MPSFAELKEQAKKAQQMAGSQVSGLRDRFQSPSTANSSHGYSSGYNTGKISSPPPPVAKKPPPPPGRTGAPGPPTRSLESPMAAPAMPSRGMPPSLPGRTPSSASSGQFAPGTSIPWNNLSEEDKYAFFALLDEYFSRRGLHDGGDSAAYGAPTPVVLNGPTRPSATHTRAAPASQEMNFEIPPTSLTSATVCEFFLPSTRWDSAWYEDKKSSLPPPVLGHKDVQGGAGWSSYGDAFTRHGYVLFADLSVLWYQVEWNGRQRDPNQVTRSAMYRPSPEPWTGELLTWAHDVYGEDVARFAEQAEALGQPIAHGECWDLAHQALLSISTNPDTAHFPAPVISINRTHGHLIFAGAGGSSPSAQVGRWRGGDDRVRRGDIVEWNRVQIMTTDRMTMKLGDPEHTAIIISVPDEPIPSAADGADVKPYELGWIEVVEQSKGHPPMRRTYDMAQMQSGRVWVYRPVPKEDYVGPGVNANWPPPQPAYAL